MCVWTRLSKYSHVLFCLSVVLDSVDMCACNTYGVCMCVFSCSRVGVWVMHLLGHPGHVWDLWFTPSFSQCFGAAWQHSWQPKIGVPCCLRYCNRILGNHGTPILVLQDRQNKLQEGTLPCLMRAMLLYASVAPEESQKANTLERRE